MEYKELTLNEIIPSLLDNFNRYEEIHRAWRTEKGIECLKEVHYTENWDKAELRRVCNGLRNTVENGGVVLAAFDKNILIGFTSLEHEFFGSRKQYIQMSMLHVTRDYRHKGAGKILFSLCSDKAKEFGAKKLYISASSCESAQYFYRGVGCVPAKEINQKLFELEPYDCHMEYVL